VCNRINYVVVVVPLNQNISNYKSYFVLLVTTLGRIVKVCPLQSFSQKTLLVSNGLKAFVFSVSTDGWQLSYLDK
jgi:hypothetical protein